MNFTVVNNARGAITVHRPGCRDIEKAARGGTAWPVEADSLKDIVTDVYPPDEFGYDDSEWTSFAGDIRVMACAGNLPDETPPSNTQPLKEIEMTTTRKATGINPRPAKTGNPLADRMASNAKANRAVRAGVKAARKATPAAKVAPAKAATAKAAPVTAAKVPAARKGGKVAAAPAKLTEQYTQGTTTADGWYVVLVCNYRVLLKRANPNGTRFEWIARMSDGTTVGTYDRGLLCDAYSIQYAIDHDLGARQLGLKFSEAIAIHEAG